MIEKIKVLIVDDEKPARTKLLRLLERDDRVQVVGEAVNGLEAVQFTLEKKPDLLLLDIQMPEMDGFEVLDILGGKCPRVIFTTAFDQYAIRAFEVRALDYLLKPFDAERLQTALDRALEDIRTSQGDVFAEKVENLLAQLRNEKPYLRRILLKLAGRIIFVETSEVERIESEEKYLRLHVGKNNYLYRETLTHLESRLDPSLFVRVHRSHIVNMQFVRELEYLSHGDYNIVMKDDNRVPLGRTYRDQVFRRLSEGTDPEN